MTPHFDGRVGYRIDDDHVVLEVEAIRNPRADDNISGSLSLELRAVVSPDRGGRAGHLLGRDDLGRLAGQQSLTAIAPRVPFTPPAPGEWELVMALCEWTDAAGYVTRDHARFAIPYLAAGEAVTPSPENNGAPEPENAAPVPENVAPGPEDAAPESKNAASVPETAAPVTLDVEGDAQPARPVAPPPAPAERAPDAEPTRRRANAAGVSVNHATVAEIAAVKGISRTLAELIVRGRPYSSVSGLLDVRGIGPRLLEKLRPYLSL